MIDHCEARVELGGGLNGIISFLTWILEEFRAYPNVLRDVNMLIHYNGNDDFDHNAQLHENWHQSPEWWGKIGMVQTLTSYFSKLLWSGMGSAKSWRAPERYDKQIFITMDQLTNGRANRKER